MARTRDVAEDAPRRARPLLRAALLGVGVLWVGGCGGGGPTAPPPPAYTYGIYDAQWTGGTDLDGDGYWETRRLAWDADVSDPTIARSVRVKVYARPTGTSTWSLVGTTDCYTITGVSTSDVHYADLGGFTRGSWDIRLEVYECSGTSAVASRGPGDDPDLGAEPLEELAYAIFNATWTNGADVDQDGCWESVRLSWDADVNALLPPTKSVEARVFVRPTSGGPWELITTVGCYDITGTSSSDVAWVDLFGQPGDFDFAIDLYECGGGPVASVDPVDFPTLSNRCFEPALTIFDAWWTNVVDLDNDGYWESADLNWDADVVGSSATVSVQARIYYRLTGTTTWTLLGPPLGCYLITGVSTSDTYAVPLISNVAACYEFWIDLYDCGGVVPAARLGPADDLALGNQCFEP